MRRYSSSLNPTIHIFTGWRGGTCGARALPLRLLSRTFDGAQLLGSQSKPLRGHTVFLALLVRLHRMVILGCFSKLNSSQITFCNRWSFVLSYAWRIMNNLYGRVLVALLAVVLGCDESDNLMYGSGNHSTHAACAVSRRRPFA
jgi:hypothetical protein